MNEKMPKERLAQSESLAKLVSINEGLLAKEGLTVDDLLDELDTQRDIYNQEKYGVKRTKRFTVVVGEGLVALPQGIYLYK